MSEVCTLYLTHVMLVVLLEAFCTVTFILSPLLIILNNDNNSRPQTMTLLQYGHKDLL